MSFYDLLTTTQHHNEVIRICKQIDISREIQTTTVNQVSVESMLWYNYMNLESTHDLEFNYQNTNNM